MKTAIPAFATASVLAFLTSCSTPGPYTPQDTTKYTLENTSQFVLLDQPTQTSITCTGLEPRTLPDGRLDVVALVKNREDRRIQVQIQCVFKDANGFSTGDETPWENLILAEYSTETVHFTAMNTLAKNFTIRVRQAR
ncbi:MAG TPA: YcfL family protein [Opitutaceae bacterium]|nr:YcfL family protein [Opitutaceae bacterium]